MNQIDELRYLIQCVQREGTKKFGALLKEELDITPSQSEVIMVLSEHEPLSLVELGNLLLCESKSPSRLVKRLVERGVIFQSQSLEDSRKTVLHLTKYGRELVPKIREIENLFNHEIEKNLSDRISVQELNDILTSQISNTDSEKKLSLRKLDE